jgi:hypothetical protein
VVADASSAGGLILVFGIAMLLIGTAMLRDWGGIGTVDASIWAMFSYARGRRAFARDWNRRSTYRRRRGLSALALGTGLSIFGLALLVH